jgi:hypothetical protein
VVGVSSSFILLAKAWCAISCSISRLERKKEKRENIKRKAKDFRAYQKIVKKGVIYEWTNRK